ERKMLLAPSFKPTRRAVIDIAYFHDRVRGDSWMSLNKIPKLDSIGGPVEDLWSAHANHALVDDADGRGERRNKRTLVSMTELIKALLAWVTPEDGSVYRQPSP